MPSDGLCFVCRTSIANNDMGMRSVEFVGDAQYEHGRYAAHMECTAGLRHLWLTRNRNGQLVPLASRNAPRSLPWHSRLAARFFAWGMAKFQPQRRFE